MSEFDGKLGHLEGISQPWANAGGVARSMEEVLEMAKTETGWIEDGSHTIPKRLGNAVDPKAPELGARRRVYTYNPTTGETGNSFGMPGQGMDALEQEIPEKDQIAESHGKRYVLNVAPVSEDPVSETLELVYRGFSAGARAVLVNGGCPNVIMEDGERHELLSRSPEELRPVLGALKPVVEKFAPVFLRISPQESYSKAERVYRVIRESGVVSAVFVPNTWPDYMPLDEFGKPILEVPGGVGGKSGPATAQKAAEQTRWAVKLLAGSEIDVVSSGGIKSGNELKLRLDIGAKAGAGTTFYYQPEEGWIDDTSKLLYEYRESF